MADIPDAVFHVDGNRLIPTALARGPWDPNAQHGGGPAALFARAVETCDPGPASFVARLTVELLRPVPLEPLEVTAQTVRPGKKVQWIEATMRAGDTEIARARALRIRRAELDLPRITPNVPAMPAPDECEVIKLFPFAGSAADVGFWLAMEMRQARGSWTDPGPAAAWFRLRVPMVAGEEPSPLQRVAAAADFGNGISSALERGAYLFINPDLTVYLHDPPATAWVGLDAVTAIEPEGVGLAIGVLHDERGVIGRSVQALLVDRF